jgi:hypothetical protein
MIERYEYPSDTEIKGAGLQCIQPSHLSSRKGSNLDLFIVD